MVLRNDRGNIIFSSCRQLFSCRDALEAELCASMESLSLTIQQCDAPIIEMDSLVVVELIQARNLDRSIYASIVKEIKYLMSLRDWCITHVSRNQNKDRDNLANFARMEGRAMTWLGSGPPVVVELALADCNLTILE